MPYDYVSQCSLLVNSCDNYSITWYPYFELLKKYWKHPPAHIYLNTETKEYHDEYLNIKTIRTGKDKTWSARLLQCLNEIETEYLIFSLEDFFLLDYIKEDVIDQCLSWMKADPGIAACQFIAVSNKELKIAPDYGNFRIAGDDVGYRLNTQVALWRKSDLISFIDASENPWQFEGFGTKRLIGTDKKFLWLYSPENEDVNVSVFPYHVNQRYGYGVTWGNRWLWKNKEWFVKNGIKHVKYHPFGTLSERSVKLRYRYLYRVGLGPAKGIEKLIYIIYRRVDQLEKGLIKIRLHGLKDGINAIGKMRR